MICNNNEALQAEFALITEIFQYRGYPSYIINQCILKSLNPSPVPTRTDNNQQDTMYASLYYYPALSQKLVKIWKTSIQQFNIPVNMRFTFKPVIQTKRFIKNYSNTEQNKMNVVYAVRCKDCTNNNTLTVNASHGWYIGETTQYLSKRLYQHLKQNTSNIYQHSLVTHHVFDMEHPVILDVQNNPLKLMISESKFIQKYKPTINSNEGLKLLLN